MILAALIDALALLITPIHIVVSLVFNVVPLLTFTAVYVCLFSVWWLCGAVGLALLALTRESFKQLAALGTLFD